MQIVIWKEGGGGLLLTDVFFTVHRQFSLGGRVFDGHPYRFFFSEYDFANTKILAGDLSRYFK